MPQGASRGGTGSLLFITYPAPCSLAGGWTVSRRSGFDKETAAIDIVGNRRAGSARTERVLLHSLSFSRSQAGPESRYHRHLTCTPPPPPLPPSPPPRPPRQGTEQVTGLIRPRIGRGCSGDAAADRGDEPTHTHAGFPACVPPTCADAQAGFAVEPV